MLTAYAAACDAYAAACDMDDEDTRRLAHETIMAMAQVLRNHGYKLA